MLQPPGETTIAWAVFDAAWYLARYPDVRSAIGDAGDPGVLSFYLEQGQKLGHSPNIWFDEIWYMRQNADAAMAARSPASMRIAWGTSITPQHTGCSTRRTTASDTT